MRNYLIALLLILAIAGGCSGSGKKDPIMPSLRMPVLTSAQTLENVLAIKFLRIYSSGQIEVLAERAINYGELSQLNIPEDIDVVFHLQAVDENYNASWMAQNGVVDPDETRRSIAIRFKYKISSNLEGQYFITCPRAIFIPIPEGEGGSGNGISVSTPGGSRDGSLNLDLGEYSIEGIVNPPEGPYDYMRILDDNDKWEIDKIAYGDDVPESAEMGCQVVIPVDPDEGVPAFIDWVIIFDGILNESSSGPVWPDPYSITGLQVKRRPLEDVYYDRLWNLDVLRIDDAFDLSVFLPLAPGAGNSFEGTAYNVYVPISGSEENILELEYVGQASDIAMYSYLNAYAYDIFGAFPFDSGMHDFDIHVKRTADESYYLSKTFQLPLANPDFNQPEDLYDSGYHIIAGVAAGGEGTSLNNGLRLMNSFTKEIKVLKYGDQILGGVGNISMQKALGGTYTNHIRVAFDWGPAQAGSQSVAVWDWSPTSGNQGIETIYDKHFGSNYHAVLPAPSSSNMLTPVLPILDPKGDLLFWSAKYDLEVAPTYSNWPYGYKDEWLLYDGFCSTYDGAFETTTTGGDLVNAYIHQFDPDWESYKENEITYYPYRCGGNEAHDPPLASLQDNMLLMQPSVSSEVDVKCEFLGLVYEGKAVSCYVVAFARSGDCGEEYTSLIIYFIELDSNSTDVSQTAVVEFCPSGYCETDIWGNSGYNNSSDANEHIGKHTGPEKHFINPMVTEDGSTIIYEAYDNGFSRIYKIDIDLDYAFNDEGLFISDSYEVGGYPITGPYQYKPVVNSSFWNPHWQNGEGQYQDLPTDIIIYQDGMDSNTDIWLAFKYDLVHYYRHNVTGPFSLNFDAYSGQPDMSTRHFFYGMDYYVRSGIVFTSQKYDQGDLFMIDHVYSLDMNSHWTKIRRLTNAGEVGQVRISNFIPIIAS